MKKLFLILPLALLSLLTFADEVELQGHGHVHFRLVETAILNNTENIRLLVKSRYNSNLIISDRHLARGIDYTIDYEGGFIALKYPAQATDSNFNPQFINAHFEVEGSCQ